MDNSKEHMEENKDEDRAAYTDCDDEIGILYEALPSCDHEIRAKELYEGGGIVCTKCGGWFCY